jgi:hypothetical protein
MGGITDVGTGIGSGLGLDPLLVPHRFCGPPTSGNGGWTCGALAAHLHEAACPEDRSESWPTVEVTLRMPPPLDVPLPLERSEDGVTSATSREGAVATGRVVADEPVVVPAVDLAEARAAEAGFAGWHAHPFPTCFTCGTGREEGDGLRIFPGRLGGDGPARVAAGWVPDPSLSEDYHAYGCADRRASLASTWAALDCPGGWAGDLAERPSVLGRMTARVLSLPRIGEEHVVVGEARGVDGRKMFTAASLYAADGSLVGTAEHVWISIDPDAFR